MAALLTRLNLLLTFRLFRSSVAGMVGLAVAALYGVGFLVAAVLGAAFLRDASPHNIGWVTTWVLALVAAGWPAVESFGGTMDPLNPPRFALLPLRARDLQPGLLISTIVSVEGLVVGVLWAAYLLAWSRHPSGLVVAALAGVVGIPLSAASCRLGMTYIASRMASRRNQDRLMMVFTVGLMVVILGITLFDRAFTDDGSITISFAGVERWAPVLGWTPFGWLWSMPWEAVSGTWWAAAVKLALSVATFAGVWFLWGRLLDGALTEPFEIGGGVAHVDAAERGIAGLLPQGPVGAIARRTLQYWRRDPRRKMQGIMVAVLPLVLSFALSSGSDGIRGPYQLVVPLAVVFLLGANLVAGELTYDGGAVWHQIVAGVTAREDRWGRLLGLAVFVVPSALLLCLGYLAWTGEWRLGVLLAAAMLGFLGVAGGVGSWVGAIWSYAVPPPGLTFNTSRGGMSALLGVLLGSIVQTILLAPVLAVAAAAIWNPQWLWLSVLVSVGIGAASLWGGVAAGASYLEDSWPETLARVTWARR